MKTNKRTNSNLINGILLNRWLHGDNGDYSAIISIKIFKIKPIINVEKSINSNLLKIIFDGSYSFKILKINNYKRKFIY